MGKGGGFEKCKGVGGQVQRKIRGRSEKTEGDRREMESKVKSKGG